MCGIAGLLSAAGDADLKKRVARMLQAVAHRGPNDEGAWTNAAGNCVLGHRRLSIIDLAGGHQPMANEDETVWISFNGCIYNYEDLARELRQLGHKFQSHSDTEVILHAYEQWGGDCVRRFNGMWAFAIWDERRRQLFCSRDRLGVKPFYYVWENGNFAFASEIKALFASGATEPQADVDGLRQYLTFQFCLGERTLFRNVLKLEPGCNLVLKQDVPPEISRYWDIPGEVDLEHTEDWFLDRIEALLQDAVRLRLRADVPLGTHLSGGLDSSAVLSLARNLLGAETSIKTFTGAFREGSAFDETRHAKLMSRAANSEYIEIYLTAEDFRDSIEKIIWFMDEPAAGPGVFPQYLVSKLASQNVTVVLGGQGGDEIFLGYARYLIAYLEECLKGAIDDTAGRAQYVATLSTIVPSLPDLQTYMPMLTSFWSEGLFEEPARRYYRLMDRFSQSSGLLHPDFKADEARTFDEFRAVFEGNKAKSMINRISYFDLKTHLQSLLHVEDRTSMAWALESRVPLLDYRLVEQMAAIPPVVKFRNGQLKYLFRKAIRNLVPQEILNRRDKMGFPVPLNRWLQNELREFVADTLLSERCRGRGLFDHAALQKTLASTQTFSRSLWGALCLELWHRQFLDR